MLERPRPEHIAFQESPPEPEREATPEEQAAFADSQEQMFQIITKAESSDYLEPLQKLREETGYDLAPETIERAYAYLVENYGRRNWSVSSIDTFLGLHDYTGALPSDATLREMFNQLVRSGSSSAIDCLRRELRAPPVFDDEAVQDGYKELFGSGYIPSKERYRRYEQLTGRAIEETTAQILYGIKAEAGNPDAIRALRKFSGIRPVFDAQSVEKGYDQLVKSGRADDLGKLARQTQVRVELSSEQIDAGFDSLLRNSTGWSFKKRYHAWTAYTRGRPRPKDVQENFRHFITHGRADAIKAIQKITGLRPEPALIDDALERYFIENTSYHSLKPLLEVLGIALAPDLVQRAYRVIVLSDYRARERIKEISGFTGTAPDPGMVAELMEEVLGSASPPYQLNKLIAAGFSPDAARISTTLGRLLQEKRSDDFFRVVVLVKDIARPSEAELEAFFNLVTEMRREWGLITRLREAGFSLRPELVHAYYGRLNFAISSDMDALGEVIRATGVLPPEEMTIAAYQKNIENVAVEMVAKLHELTGTPVTVDDPAIVQDAYNEIILKKEVALVTTLQALTGILPVFVPSAVEARYEKIGENVGWNQPSELVDRLFKLHEVTGLRPMRLDRLTFYYGRMAQQGDIGRIEKLKAVLGVEPVFDPYAVKAGFVYLVMSHGGDVKEELEALGACTGIPVESEDIQSGYLKSIQNDVTQALDRMEKIVPQLGVSLSDETILAAYQQAIRDRGYMPVGTNFTRIMKLAGKPIPRDIAEQGIAVCLEAGDAKGRAEIETVTGVALTPDLIQRAYQGVIWLGKFDRLAGIQKETGVPMIYTPGLEGAVQSHLHQASPRNYVLTFRKLQAIWPDDLELAHHNPWGEMFMRLASLQAPAEREEYDPWKTDLEPLLQNVGYDRTPEGGEDVYEFVKEFGMIAMPRVFEWFRTLRRATTVADVGNRFREEIEQALGRSLDDFPDQGAVIAEIKKFKQRIQEDLLKDVFPSEAVKSDAGVEMLLAIRGSGSWSRGGDVRSVLDAWRQTVTDKPEVAAMPEGYVPMSIEVARVERQETGDEEQRIRKVLDNEDLRLILERLDAPYRAMIRSPMQLGEWWSSAQGGAVKLIESELASLEAKAAVESNPKKLTSMHARVAELRDRITDVRALAFPELKNDDTENDYVIVQFMESLRTALPEKMSARDDLLRAVSALHSLQTLPDGQRAELEAIARDTSAPHDVKHAEFYHDLLINFLNEHYLHPDQQDHERTSHTGFSKELLRELRGAWGLKGDLKKHPLVLAADKVRRLREGTTTDTGKTMPIELVPARGAMRVFAGDVGNACYTSRYNELARGDFPGLTAFIFVTGRGTTQERMRGSVLAIETKTPDDKKVLVVRANNPQEALLSQVKTDELMEKTLDAMIELAVRRGMDYVVVPRDGSSQAATNRPAVFEWYRRAHGDKKKLQLVNEPATNFNGYNIWEANGQHAVVKVWEKGE